MSEGTIKIVSNVFEEKLIVNHEVSYEGIIIVLLDKSVRKCKILVRFMNSNLDTQKLEVVVTLFENKNKFTGQQGNQNLPCFISVPCKVSFVPYFL